MLLFFILHNINSKPETFKFFKGKVENISIEVKII